MRMTAKVRDNIKLDSVKDMLAAIAGQANKRAAEFMAERAKSYCPVDTGFLRSTITVLPESIGSYQVLVYAPYASAVEWGHISFGTWVPPNPFMRMARDDTIEAYPNFVAEARVTHRGGGQIGVSLSR